MKSLIEPRTLNIRTAGFEDFDQSPFASSTSDSRFRALVENSSEVICIGSPDGTILYTTPSVKRVLGYDPSAWLGRNAFEIMRADHARIARVALRQLAATPVGTVIRLVTQVRHKDDSWRWVEAVLTNLINQPAFRGIVCNYRDITDSHNAAEALRASEQRYRLLADALPQMVSVRASDGLIEYCNSNWLAYRGIKGDGPIVHDWKEGVHPDDLASLRPPPWPDGVPAPWEAEARLRAASDGQYRWHSVRIVPLVKEGTPRWLAIATDIHERKQAGRELERLLVQLERERGELAVQYAVVRVLAESLTIADAAPRLLAAFCEQLGWQAGALWITGSAGQPARALSLVHIHQQPSLTPRSLLRRSLPSPPAKGQCLAGRVWAARQPLFLPRLSSARGPAHHRAAARLGLRAAFAFPILLAGEVQGVVELFCPDAANPGQRLIDIVSAVGIQIGQFIQRTHALDLLRKSEEALIQVNNALEMRVRERTSELREANLELSSEIGERARLEREIIRISEREQRRIGQDLHDGLCQELTAIAFMTRALSTRLRKGDTHDAAGPIDADRMNQVSSLLNDSVARCRDIARGLHPVEMDADGLMVALAELAERTHRSVSCSFLCKEPILMPESDIALNLYRIAQEAVDNAVKYARATRITISLDRTRNDLRLAIRDNGCGIPALSTRLRRKRAGMGIHIMRYRARTMGAALHLLTLKPHGTEVSCLLPARRPPR